MIFQTNFDILKLCDREDFQWIALIALEISVAKINEINTTPPTNTCNDVVCNKYQYSAKNRKYNEHMDGFPSDTQQSKVKKRTKQKLN